MKKFGLVVALLAICMKAGAVEGNPKHVFIRSDCSGPLGTAIVSSLRDAIRASPDYQLAHDLTQGGAYKVVLTISIECSGTRMPNSSELVVSVASIIGRGMCTGANCTTDYDANTLQAMLCSGTRGQECGKDIYGELDEYMSGYGGEIFDAASRRTRAVGTP